MATRSDRRRLDRSGSLSSGHGSESSGSEDGGSRIRSAVVQAQVKPLHRVSPPRRRHGRSYSRSPSPRPKSLEREPRRTRVSPPRRRQVRSRSSSPRSLPPEVEDGEVSEEEPPPAKRKKEEPDPLLTRTGGAYIPPARLRMMQQQITDKSSVTYQRLSWEALKKSINGLINKVNVSNIANIVQELFQENVVRGRGLLTRSLIQAQAASPTFTHVYASLVSILNTKFPQTGELIAKRLIIQFRKGFRRNDKNICVTAVKFLAHLVNQQVLHELVALELLTLMLEEPSDDSVEVAIGFLKECGLKLTEVTPRGVHAVFETLRSILHSGKLTPRVQYMIEVMFAIRKDGFKDHPTVLPELDLVQEEDQITHLVSLNDDLEPEEMLNVFQADPDYLANEEKYKAIKEEILGDGEGSESGSSGEESGEEEDSDEEEEEEQTGIDITDRTDAKAMALRRQIYLTIMSSLDYEECAHKMLKSLEAGQESEVAYMVIECCSQERSYLRFYGLLGQRFCQLNQAWVEQFDAAFQQQYATVHRLETNKLRNVAKFFAQLFYADALPWTSMSCIHLNEEETNSSSRIFVKIMFQELAEFMGMGRLNERMKDPILSLAFEGLLPRDNPKNTRFAINFFTSIGLGGLTDDLREHLKNAQKLIMAQKQQVSSSDTSESESEESSDDSESSSESSSSSSEDERPRRRKKQKGRGEKTKDSRKPKEKKRREDIERRDKGGSREQEERDERGRRREKDDRKEKPRERKEKGSTSEDDERRRDRKQRREQGKDRGGRKQVEGERGTDHRGEQEEEDKREEQDRGRGRRQEQEEENKREEQDRRRGRRQEQEEENKREEQDRRRGRRQEQEEEDKRGEQDRGRGRRQQQEEEEQDRGRGRRQEQEEEDKREEQDRGRGRRQQQEEEDKRGEQDRRRGRRQQQEEEDKRGEQDRRRVRQQGSDERGQGRGRQQDSDERGQGRETDRDHRRKGGHQREERREYETRDRK